MGIIYEGVNQIPTDKDYDIVKVVPPGKVIYKLEDPNKVLFPGQRTSSKHGFKVTGEGAKWALDDIGSYISRYSEKLDQPTLEKLKEFIKLPEKQEDSSKPDEDLREVKEEKTDDSKLEPRIEFFFEELENKIQQEKEKQVRGEEPDLDKIQDILKDLNTVFEEDPLKDLNIVFEEEDPLKDLDIVFEEEKEDLLRNLQFAIEEEKKAKEAGFEVNFDRILQELLKVKEKILESVNKVSVERLKEASQEKQEETAEKIEETSTEIKEGNQSLDDFFKAVEEINKELEELTKETPKKDIDTDFELDLDGLTDTPEFKKSLIEKELEKLENERKELEKELKEINPKERLFLEKLLDLENLSSEEKEKALESLQKQLESQRNGLIESMFDSVGSFIERDLLSFYRTHYLGTLDPEKKLESIEKIFAFIAQARLLDDLLSGKRPVSYVLDLWKDVTGRGEVFENYLRLAMKDDDFLLSVLKAAGFDLEDENFLARTIVELRNNFASLEEADGLMYLSENAADNMVLFYVEEEKEIKSSAACNDYYKLATGKTPSKAAREFKEKFSRIKEKIKELETQISKLLDEAEQIQMAEDFAELAKEQHLDEAFDTDINRIKELKDTLGLSEEFVERLYSIQPREQLFSQLLTFFQNSLTLIRGISSFLFDKSKDQITVTQYDDRYSLFDQAFRVLVDSYLGNTERAIEESAKESDASEEEISALKAYLKNNFDNLYEASLGIALHYIAEAINEAAIDENTGKIDYENLVKKVKKYLLESKVVGSLQNLEEELVYGATDLGATRCLSMPSLDRENLSISDNSLVASYNKSVTKNASEMMQSIAENSIRLKDYLARAILCALTSNDSRLEDALVPLTKKLEEDEDIFTALLSNSVLNREKSAIKASSLRYLSDEYRLISDEIFKISTYVFGLFGADVDYGSSEDSLYLKITSHNTAERLLLEDELDGTVSKLGKILADFYRDGKVVFDSKRFSQMFKIDEEQVSTEDVNIVTPTQEDEESPIKLNNNDIQAINDFLQNEEPTILVPARLNDGSVGELSLVKNADGTITASIQRDGEEIVNNIFTQEEIEEFLENQKASEGVLAKLLDVAKKALERFKNLSGGEPQQPQEEGIFEQSVSVTESPEATESISTKEVPKKEEVVPTNKVESSSLISTISSLGYTDDESSKTFDGLKKYLSSKVENDEKVEQLIEGISNEISKLSEDAKKAVIAILHSAFNPQFIYQIDNTGVEVNNKKQLVPTIRKFLLSRTKGGQNKLEVDIGADLGSALKSKAKLIITKKKPLFQLLEAYGVKLPREITTSVEKYRDFVEISIDKSDPVSSQEKPSSVFLPEEFLLRRDSPIDLGEILSKLIARTFIGAKIKRDTNPEETYRERKLLSIKEAAQTTEEDKKLISKEAEIQDKETQLRRKKKKQRKVVEYAKSKNFEQLKDKVSGINSITSLMGDPRNIPVLERDFFSSYRSEKELQEALSGILGDHIKYFTNAKNPSYSGALPIKINDTYVQASCRFEWALPVIDDEGNNIGRYINISVDFDSPTFASFSGVFSTRVTVDREGNLLTDSGEPVKQLFEHLAKSIEKYKSTTKEIASIEESAKEKVITPPVIPPPGKATIIEVETKPAEKKKPSKAKKSSKKEEAKAPVKKQVKIETKDNGDIAISVPSSELPKTIEIPKELTSFISSKDIQEAVQAAAEEPVYVEDIQELDEVENSVFSTSISDPISKSPYTIELKKEGLKYAYTINDTSGKSIYEGYFTKLPNLQGLRTRIIEDLAFVRMNAIAPSPEVEEEKPEEFFEEKTSTPSLETEKKEKPKAKEKAKEKPKTEKTASKEKEKKNKSSKKQTKQITEEQPETNVSKEEESKISPEMDTSENTTTAEPSRDEKSTDSEVPDDFDFSFEDSSPSEEEAEKNKIKSEVKSKIEAQKSSIIRKAINPSLRVVPPFIRISEELAIDFEKEETPYDGIFDIRIKLIDINKQNLESREDGGNRDEIWSIIVRSDKLEDRFDKILESILEHVK